MLRALLFVGLGGGLGSMARYGLTVFINKLEKSPFPFGTLTVNLLGCFLIGLLFGLGSRSSWTQGEGWMLTGIGFCGGFTTFSTFALDNLNLMERQSSLGAVFYSGLSLVLGILLCRIGIWLTA